MHATEPELPEDLTLARDEAWPDGIVYLLLEGGSEVSAETVVYVGQANNLGRSIGHREKVWDYTFIKFYPSLAEARAAEGRLIHHFHPYYNQVCPLCWYYQRPGAVSVRNMDSSPVPRRFRRKMRYQETSTPEVNLRKGPRFQPAYEQLTFPEKCAHMALMHEGQRVTDHEELHVAGAEHDHWVIG